MPIPKIGPSFSLMGADLAARQQKVAADYTDLVIKAESFYGEQLGKTVLNPFLDKATQERNRISLEQSFIDLFKGELRERFPLLAEFDVCALAEQVLSTFKSREKNSTRIANSKPAQKYVSAVNSFKEKLVNLSDLSMSTTEKETKLDALRDLLTKAADDESKLKIREEIRMLEKQISKAYEEQKRQVEDVCMPLYKNIKDKRQALFNDFNRTTKVSKAEIESALDAIFGEMPKEPVFVPRFANLLASPKQNALNSTKGQEFLDLKNQFYTLYTRTKVMGEPLIKKLSPMEEEMAHTKDPNKKYRIAARYNRVIDDNSTKVAAYNDSFIKGGRMLKELKARAADLTQEYFGGDSKAFEAAFGNVQNIFLA